MEGLVSQAGSGVSKVRYRKVGSYREDHPGACDVALGY